MPAKLRVATYNVHAGVDGYGRPTEVVDAAVALDADVLFLQESWRDDTYDLAAEVAARTDSIATTHVLATGWRVTGESSPSKRWQPPGALLVGNRGLYLNSEHELPRVAERRLAGARGAVRGEWCVSVVTRLPILREDVVELVHLPRDLARRRLISLTLSHSTGPLIAFGLHGAHLSHGSIGQYRELAADLDERLVDGTPAILGGDLNCWGPIARRVLGGWRQAGRGVTWPSWRPHSQLDHLFVRGPIEVVDAGPVDTRGSDHRPTAATLVVRGAGVR